MNEETKRCPFCYEQIHVQAVKCKHCGTMVEEFVVPSFSRPPSGLQSEYAISRSQKDMAHDESLRLPDHLERMLGGKYEILEELGKGGMGVVYKARQISLNRPVAIKVLSSMLSFDESFVRRFKREAQTIARLNHKNIVQIYDIEEKSETHFFIMEYVEGPTLEEILRDRGRLSVHDATRIISRAASAIEHAHKNNIIHRDIKPSNIMLDRHGHVKVTDFGLAKDTSAVVSTLTETGMIIGTLRYLSPEGCRGEQVDKRADIYSLAAVLYETLTGTAPFTAQNSLELINDIVYKTPPQVRALNPQVPAEVSDIVARAMAKDQNTRFESASHFLEALREFDAHYIEKKRPSAKKKSRKVAPLKKRKRRFLTEEESEKAFIRKELRRRVLTRWGSRLLRAVFIIGILIVMRLLFLYYLQTERNKDLLKAVRDGKIAVAERHLDKGADVNAQNERGSTGLLSAAESGESDMVKLLLDRGADPDVENQKGETALMRAASRGRIDIVRLLLERGADVNARPDNDQTALVCATEGGHTETVRLLLYEGADVDVETEYGNTPLMIAASLGHTDIVKMLLEKGADPNIRPAYGWTPLSRAQERGYTEIIELLKEAGAQE